MSDLQVSLQQQLDQALPSDIITLPGEIIDFPLVISKPCTVLGSTGTIVDVSDGDSLIALDIQADDVVVSDLSVKNKSDSNYHAIKASGKRISIERVGVSCDIGILIENASNVDLIEIEAAEAKTGIKIFNSNDVELNACNLHNNVTGLDIIGESSQKGSVDSYQGFGLNINAGDTTPLNPGEYDFKVDGLIYNFNVLSSITYQELVDIINSQVGFNPTYSAEIVGNDIIIKTENDTISIESGSNNLNLLSSLGANLQPAVEGQESSYVDLGFNFTNKDDVITQMGKNVLYTFFVDGTEIQFFSPETDGTTYQELIDLLQPKLNPLGVTATATDSDIRFVSNASSITLTNGTRFKDFFSEMGIDINYSVYLLESFQKLGLAINESDPSPLAVGSYGVVVDGIEYTFEVNSANPAYSDIIDILNNNTNFSDKYTASIDGGDVKIACSENSIDIQEIKTNLFSALGTTPADAIIGSENMRLDRTFNVNIINSLIHENQIGARIINSNDVTFTAETKVYSNTNIGIWQMPSSYNISFRGEIFNNTNYGYRNTDKQEGPHKADARESWWGDITGPSMFATGEGDKISANVLWQPVRQNGTVPDLSYPKTREFILGALGYPVVKVELTDEQIQQCIDKAISKYMQYRTPEPIQRYVTAHAGSSLVELPLDMPRQDIIEVTYSPNADIFAQLSGAGESFYLTYYLQNTGGTFLSDFYVAMAYKETMETTLGIRPTYEFLSGPNEDGEYVDFIRLAPRPDNTINIGILYSRPMTEEEIDSIDWIHKYSLAWAKEFLGRIRSKFGSVPGPTGEMQLDGPTLLSEAQQERQSLEESVMLRGEPLGFSVG